MPNININYNLKQIILILFITLKMFSIDTLLTIIFIFTRLTKFYRFFQILKSTLQIITIIHG